jgi:hypothetical protein
MWIFFEIFFFKILGLTNYKGAKKKGGARSWGRDVSLLGKIRKHAINCAIVRRSSISIFYLAEGKVNLLI